MKKYLTPVLISLLTLISVHNAAAQDTEYVSPNAPIPKGKAPGMKWKLLSDNQGVKEYSIIFAKGDEVISGLTDFATEQHVVAARFTAIGALQEGNFGWYDLSKNLYKVNHIGQQMELLSLIGDIALYDNKPVVHAHAGVGLADGSGHGGHLLNATTMPTVEVFMTTYPTPLKKMLDKETDIKLIHADLK